MPAPVVLALCPAAAVTRTPAFTLRVIGIDFEPNAWIFYNGIAMVTTRLDANMLTAEILPPATLPPDNRVSLFVYNVTPPAQSNQMWLEFTARAAAYCTPEDVRDALRITEATFDEARIDRSVLVAAEAIDGYLERYPDSPLPDPAPASIVQANINLAVEEYRRPGAAFGVLGFTDLDGTTRIAADHLAGIESMIRRYKQQWGAA
jgi:hypothetical protein